MRLKTNIKLRVSPVLILIILISLPLITQGAGAIVYVTKEFGLDIVARLISQRILGSMSQQSVDAIKKTGRDGTGAIVKDWRQFVVNSNQRGENVFRAQIAYAQQNGILCPGSRSLLGQLFLGNKSTPQSVVDKVGQMGDSLRANSLDLFQVKAKCTIPDKVFSDYNNDFQKGGGWETWSRIVEPQNNPYGLLAMSLNELDTQRGIEENADTGETRSSGFLSKRAPCVGQGQNAQCTFFGKTVTPAKILESAGVKTVDSSFNWLTTSDELSEVLISVINAAFQRLNNFIAEKTDGIVGIGGVSEDTSQSTEKQNAIDQANQAILRDQAALRQSCINSCISREQLSCNGIQDPVSKQTCLDGAVLRCNSPAQCQ